MAAAIGCSVTQIFSVRSQTSCWDMCSGDEDGCEDEDEGRMSARAEYRAFEHLLKSLPSLVPLLAEASAPNSADIASAIATLHKVQLRSVQPRF